MTGPTQIRILALILGLWMALAPAVFAVPAVAMTSQTAMGGAPDMGGCDGCPETGLDTDGCAPTCLNVMLLATLAGEAVPPAWVEDGHWLGPRPVLSGLLSAPEPAPPKPVFFH